MAILRLKNNSNNNAVNNLALAISANFDPPQIGEIVWKIGSATGLTEGRISNTSAFNIRINQHFYSNMIEVKWLPDVKFAYSGDCGAVYVVRRDAFYCPIALHVNSDDDTCCSYGVPFYDNLTHIGMECITDHWEFINPPFSASPPRFAATCHMLPKSESSKNSEKTEK